jgi:hypothetical protein
MIENDNFTPEQNKLLEAYSFRVKKSDILSGDNITRYFGSCVEDPAISGQGTDPDKILTKLKRTLLVKLEKTN